MSKFLRWVPACIVMVTIFIISSTPSVDLPSYGIWDTLVKKGGHVSGYALLALCYWLGFGFDLRKVWLAGFLAVLYAASDEVHQSFTPGRHPSVVDVFLFDGGGAVLALSVAALFIRLKNRKNA